MINIARWRRINGEILRMAEYRHFMDTGIITDDVFDEHLKYNEGLNSTSAKHCKNCALYNTEDCDDIEDPEKCVSFYDKRFDRVKYLNF